MQHLFGREAQNAVARLLEHAVTARVGAPTKLVVTAMHFHDQTLSWRDEVDDATCRARRSERA